MSLVAIASTCQADTPQSELPRRTERFVIEVGARDSFFEALRQFAERNAFAVRIAPNSPTAKSSLIQLWREDLKVIGVNPFVPEEFRISFYDNCSHPLPAERLDALADELRESLNRVKGVKTMTSTD
jgi:hypothetical protein